MTTHIFHPAVALWFDRNFPAPTEAQADAWPRIKSGENVLIAAPTGSGKTLAAFLAAIDDLVRQGLAGGLPAETHVVYVSPLKALSNDIQRNLEGPLAGISEILREQGHGDVEIRAWVRTGDTSQAERTQARKRAPHILVTTPESLYILLGSESGRAMLANTKSVIVDEIHAFVANKRGAHLALSLERLAALCKTPPKRIGLSATQKPIEEVAHFLVGADDKGTPRACHIVDTGHKRARDLALEAPAPLDAVMSNENWQIVYDRLAELIGQHKTTLIFVNTRRLAERVTAQLAARVGEEHIAAHHGSLSKEKRFDAESRLKHGKLKALVATASLELGIDIGDVDLVCDIGSSRSIASFLQRVGRSGHAVTGTPKGRLFPLSRDELVEATALLDSVRRGELDRSKVLENAADVLAQQIVAEVAARDWQEGELYALIRRSWPYRNLPLSEFHAVVTMLAEGFTTRRGRRGSLLHHDAVHGMLRGRRGARLTALTSGGAIPDNADYRVLMEPENLFIGTVNEDFAVESLAGDIFQLGNHSYRLLRVERGMLRVEDAHGQPPTIPFWLGEAPGRSDELSSSVSRLRETLNKLLDADPSGGSAKAWLSDDIGLSETLAREEIDYLAAGHAALEGLPTQKRIVFERFFDEAGGMQFVIHSPYGSRINRAWGLSLRKRFCRKFNFELQAAATEDNIVLSLTSAHSFALADVAQYLHSASVKPLLIQALLDAPMFTTRWRWVAGISLALPRFRGGRKVPPQFARMDAEDLVAAVFPDQIACGENLVGDREVPDHPLVQQAIGDCLTDAMDIDGFERLLKGIESGEIEIVTRDLTEPSPLALEVMSARPYAYLDDAPLEERRTQAVMARRWMTPQSASDLGKLDADAIARVREECWPDPANAEELHDALVWLGFATAQEAAAQPQWKELLVQLAVDKRVAEFAAGAAKLWITAERLPQFQALWPTGQSVPPLQSPQAFAHDWDTDEALVEILRGRLEGLGPVTAQALSDSLALSSERIGVALTALETEGFALRGKFTPGALAEEWCERRLLARIHGYTIKRLRAEIEPVSNADYLRFLFAWQKITPDRRMEGPDALDGLVGQLEGFEAPAVAWEEEILPARLASYKPSMLDERCLSGKVSWARLKGIPAQTAVPGKPPTAKNHAGAPVRTTPIALFLRRNAGLWAPQNAEPDTDSLSARAKAVFDFVRDNGASFFEDILEGSGLLRNEAEAALGELVAHGLIRSDSFAGLRALIGSTVKRKERRARAASMEVGGRWSLGNAQPTRTAGDRDAAVEHVARVLLRRYGIVFWRMLAREAAWLPPWRELLRAYRSLEARGEIRGGRFVAGFAGEQFALPDAIGMLRETRREKLSQAFVSVSGADPLNLAGILTPGPKLAALTGNRVLFRDGIPIALFAGGNVQFLEELEGNDAWEARKALLRSPAKAGLGNSAQSFARSLARRKRVATAATIAGAAVPHSAAAKEE